MTKALRDVFGEALVELGQTNPEVVVLDADLASATRSISFAEVFPDRFFNLGIAEANMVSVAAGLSTCGKIPYVCTFSFLLSLRAADQIRSQVVYPGLNVKLMGSNGGLSGYGDGVTHQSIMDIAVMRAMPRMTIIVPSDEPSLKWAVKAVAEMQGPAFVRIPRVPAPVVHSNETDFEIGKGICLRRGSDVTIVAMGMMVCRALEAADRLAANGVSAEVVEVHTIKPVDEHLLVESISKTGAVVTVEEHSRYGGLYSAVSELVGRCHPVPAEYVAIEDRFGESGQYEEILEACGLTAASIIAKTEAVLKRKGEGF